MTNIEEFRKFGKEMIDYVANYMENVKDYDVLPNVQPGYIRPLIPEHVPEEPDKWEDIMKDIDRVIMPGVTHWRHPHFHAYFAAGMGYPSIVADILSGAIACIGFSWIASPACTELEMAVMDWLAKLLNLPDHFLFSSNGPGGGVIQATASEATLVTLLASRARHVGKKLEHSELFEKLVAYASKEAHSSVERAAMLGGVKIRLLDTDENFSLRGETLAKAIQEDRADGLIPFFCCATLGTTSSCAFDDLEELGPICDNENIWLHVDAAYAGSAFACEEHRHHLAGIQFCNSFNFNLHKWMLVNFDCAAMWVKNAEEITESFSVDPVYLKHENQGKIPDYRHWQIPLGRRFRSLKIWFVLRLYGRTGIQAHIRNHIALAHKFEILVRQDSRFEISAPVTMGLVCFRLKGSNELNEKLNRHINKEGEIHLVPAKLGDKYMLRFAVVSKDAKSEDVVFAFNNIRKHAEKILAQQEQMAA